MTAAEREVDAAKLLSEHQLREKAIGRFAYRALLRFDEAVTRAKITFGAMRQAVRLLLYV